MKALLIALAAALGAGATVSAQDAAEAYSFLRVPASVRAFALGGTDIAGVDAGAFAALQNPASIGPELPLSAEIGYMHYLGSANFGAAAVGRAAGLHSAWCAAVRYINYGSFTHTDAAGTVLGTFAPQDIVATGVYARDITDRLRGGASIDFIYSTYESYTAIALAANLGLSYYDPERDLSLALTLRSMGGQLKRFASRYARLPFEIQAAYQQGLGHSPFTLSITLTDLQRWALPYYSTDSDGTQKRHSSFFSNLWRHITPGITFEPGSTVWASLAYNYRMRTDMTPYRRSFLSGFSIGVGMRLRGFSFGVAFAQPHRAATSLLINFATDIDALLR